MATISYGFRGTNVILANGVTQGAQWAPAFASNPAGTRHVGVWTSNAAGTDVVGRLFAGINPQSAEFAVSAALPDGGFVVAYEDTGWGNGKDITARIYNADGAARTGWLHVNAAANGGNPAGDQGNPKLALLSSGAFVVGWSDGNSFRLQAYDTFGAALGQNAFAVSNASENEIMHVGSGMIADIWRSSVSDGSGDSIRMTYHTLFRMIEGDATSETIVGIDDGTLEVLSGLAGNDTLEGREGQDSLRGGDGFDFASYVSAPVGVTASLHSQNLNTGHAAGDDYHSVEGLLGSAFDDVLTGDIGANVLDGRGGNDTLTGRFGNDVLVGGLGDDTAAFLQNLGQYTVEDFGDRIRVSGADGVDLLFSIEHLRFTDATLTPVDDGNPLFDALYYYSRNTDVYFAGADALAHFNAFGRHEGRDPNAFFDTSGYLAVNKDVAATGANPLEHLSPGRLATRARSVRRLRHDALSHPQPRCGGCRCRPARALSAVWLRRGPPGLPGDRSEHRRRLRRAVLPVPQCRRGGGGCRSARALQRLWLARGTQSECLVRHRRISRALRRRRRRGRQSARPLDAVRLAGRA
jgi:Ca2+-binding RTX toxin-like protein